MADFFAKKPAGKQPAKAKGITSFFKPKEKVEKSKVAQTPPPNDNKENDADEAMDEEEEAEKGEDEEEVEVEEAEESEEAEKDDEAQKEEEEEEDEEVVEKAAEEVKEKVKKEEEVPKVPVSSFFQPRAKVAEKPPSKPTPKSAASPAKAKPKAKEEKIEEKDEEAQVEDKEEDSNEEDVVEEEEEDEEEDDDDSGDEESAKTKKPKAKKVDKQASKTEGESEEEAGTWKPGQYGAATWKAGKDVPYLALAEMFAQVEAEGSRLLNTKYLANCFRSIISTTPSNLLPAVYLTMASVAPAYEGVELGIGDFILVKALAESCGGKVQMIKDKLKEEGDIGEVAEQVRAKQKTMFPPPPLTIVGVYKTLRQIADIKGSKSGAQKSNLIKKLLVSCRGREARFISRCLQGNLRIGLAGAGVLAGLGQAVALTPPGKDVLDTRKTLGKAKAEKLIEDCSELIKQAYTEVPNFDLVIKALLEHGCEALPTQCFLTPGIPIKVMLGKPAKGIKEVQTHAHRYKHIHAHTHIHIHTHFRIYINVSTCTYMHTRRRTYTHTHMHTHIGIGEICRCYVHHRV
jgi:DNA ligase-1